MRKLLTPIRGGASGVLLLEVIFAAGMLGLAALAMATYAANRKQAKSSIQVRGGTLDLQRYFDNAASCTGTLKTQVQFCDGTTPITLRGSTSPNTSFALTDANGVIGTSPSYGIKTTCTQNSGYYSIKVQYRATNSAGAPVTDPLTGSLSQWTNLYPDPGLTCGHYRILYAALRYEGALGVYYPLWYFPWAGADPNANQPSLVDRHVFIETKVRFLTAATPLVAADLVDVDLVYFPGSVDPPGGAASVANFYHPGASEVAVLANRFLNNSLHVIFSGDNPGVGLETFHGYELWAAIYDPAFPFIRSPFAGNIPDPEAIKQPAQVQTTTFLRGAVFDYCGPTAPPCGYNSPGFLGFPAGFGDWAQVGSVPSQPAWSTAIVRMPSGTRGLAYVEGNAGSTVQAAINNLVADKFMEITP